MPKVPLVSLPWALPICSLGILNATRDLLNSEFPGLAHTSITGSTSPRNRQASIEARVNRVEGESTGISRTAC